MILRSQVQYKTGIQNPFRDSHGKSWGNGVCSHKAISERRSIQTALNTAIGISR